MAHLPRVLGGPQARQDVQDIEAKFYAVHIRRAAGREDNFQATSTETDVGAEPFEASAEAEVDAKLVVAIGTEDDATEDGLYVYSEKWARLGPLAQPHARGLVEAHIKLWQRCASGTRPCLILEDKITTYPRLAQIAAHLVATVERVVTDANERTVLLYLGGTVQPTDWLAQWLPTDMAIPPSQGRAASEPIVLREASAVSGCFCYLIWPLAAKRMLANLPLSTPADQFLTTQIRAARVRALVVQPKALAAPDPYQRQAQVDGPTAGPI